MEKRKWLIVAGWLYAGIVAGQSLPSATPLASREHEARAPMRPGGVGWVFQIHGKKYEARLAWEQIMAGPEWTPALQLPLSFAKAEEIARTELRKLAVKDAEWEVTELTLRRGNEETSSKWYYLVKLMPKVREKNVISDMFYLPIGFSGESGKIQGL